ncbi:MAG: transcription antiterminator [Clostridiales bacterium]|nr:transcription antiterminator [Clostridiales bacterium]
MDFTPRLVQILYLLLHASRPVTAAELAEHLQINKRTVFREMDHVDRQLGKYGLVLKRKSGVGYVLESRQKDKDFLLSELEVSDSFDPRNKEKRQQKLIQVMLEADEQQKLFYYADLLQVSEATISKDLEIVEQWFGSHQIWVQRQSGVGIGLVYTEENIRNAMLAYMLQYDNRIFAPESLRKEVEATALEEGRDILNRLARISEQNFIMYTVITVERIRKGKYIEEDSHDERANYQEYYSFICRLSDDLEDIFDISVRKGDRYALYIFLQGCKVQYIQNDEEFVYIDGEEIDVRDMVYRMANAFDSAAAHELKEDEEFIQGLIAHLVPAITRIMHNQEAPNPMQDEVKAVYPDIYKKAAIAAEVMEQMIHIKISEDEIGFLALHFGGAMMRIDNARRQRHVVHIGVLCSNGIGISTLISSELRHYFGDRIRVEALNVRALSKAEVDFLVSTFPVKSEFETICVNPMLDKNEFQEISELIEKYAFREKRQSNSEKEKDNVYEAMLITNEINSILKNFSFRKLNDSIHFEEAVHEISMMLGDAPKKTEQIYLDFKEREALSTQIIEEFEMVFLHASTAAVSQTR